MFAKISVLFALFQLVVINVAETDVERYTKKSFIVPDMLDKAPKYLLKVKYPESGKQVYLGEELTPLETKKKPDLIYTPKKNTYYTLVLSDPGTKRSNPTIDEFVHWLVVNIPGCSVEEGDDLTSYVGPGPPKGTGLHRYVFFLFEQPHGEIKFKEKRHSRTDGNRGKFSTRKFATKYNLGKPVALNFFTAKYDDSVPAIHKQLGF